MSGSKLNSKNILVAGAAGFIGTNLTIRLLEEGANVIAVDNFSSGMKTNVSLVEGHKNYKFIEHDITSELGIDEDIDIIINLACAASPAKYEKLKLETIKASTLGNFNLLDLAKEKNSKYIFSSTSEMYGNTRSHPQSENDFGYVNPVGDKAYYKEAKRCGETICETYKNLYGIETVIIRIFNTYGLYMDKDDGRVVTNFIKKCIDDKPMEIYGQGEHTRSFCYVDDMVDALVLAIEHEQTIEGPINLGNDRELSLIDLAKLIKEETGSASEIKYLPEKEDDVFKRRPNIDKARRILGWEPKVDVEEGLIKTIEYIKSLK